MPQPRKHTQEQIDWLRSHYRYDPETGDIYTRLGKAEHLDENGYITIATRFGKQRAHRMAWEIYYGSDPTMTIDHINGIKTDNRISNLRDVSLSMNTSLRFGRNKDTGCVGICYISDGKGNYYFRTTYKRKAIYFKTLAEAIRFRQERGLRL